MPLYSYVDAQGRPFNVNADHPLTPEEQAEAAKLAFPTGATNQLASEVRRQPWRYKAPEEPWWYKPYDVTKSVVGGGLELLGRPQEALAGAVGGALAGGIDEAKRRAWAGLTDPNAEESFSKVLEERGVLKDSPALRTVAGFTADMLLDPLNLLSGGGILRKGLVAGAGKAGKLINKAEEAKKIARIATGIPLGEAFQSKVAGPLGEKVLDLAAQTRLKHLMLYPELRKLKFSGENLTGADVRRISQSKLAVLEDLTRRQSDDLLKGIAPEDRQLLALGMADPLSPEGLTLAARADLQPAAQKVQQAFDEIYTKDVAAGLIPERMALATGQFQSLLDKLTPRQRTLLNEYFQNPTDPKFAKIFDKNPALARLTKTLEAQVSAQSVEAGRRVQLYDPRTIRLEVNAKTGVLEPTVSTKGVHYMPGYRKPAATVEEAALQRPVSVFRDTSMKLDEAAKKRTSFNVAAAEGKVVTDIGDILSERLLNSERARESLQLLDRYATEFGSATKTAQASAQFSEDVLKTMPPQIAEKFASVYLPKEVVNELSKFVVRANNPEALEGMLSRGTKVFKALATSFDLPRYHLVNFMGNVGNMYASGMSVPDIMREYATAFKASRKGGDVYGTINLRVPHRTTPGGPLLTSLSGDELLDTARRYGIIGQATGYASEFARTKKLTPIAERLTRGRLNPLSPDEFVGYRATQKLGQQVVEDPARLALFVHELKSGKSVDEAAMAVKKYLFDYTELSDVEKKFVTPATVFYTFTRKNVPLQYATALKNPVRLTNQDRMVQMVDELVREDEARAGEVENIDRARFPESFRLGGEFQLPWVAGGRTQLPVMGRARLPVYDIRMPERLLNDAPGVAAGYLNPYLMMPIELYQGKEYREGMPALPIYEGVSPATALGQVLGLSRPTLRGEQMQNLTRYLTNQLPITTLGRALLTPARAGEDMQAPGQIGAQLLGFSPRQLRMQDLVRGTQERQQQRAKTWRRRQKGFGGSAWQALEPDEPR